ncbi:MAG: hypothetical protein WC057_03895 [Dehalococcoidales bacterium]|jgi:hypothetical protein
MSANLECLFEEQRQQLLKLASKLTDEEKDILKKIFTSEKRVQ